MKEKFSAHQIDTVLSYSANSPQCACPAQVCGTIVDLRELYEYQMNCLNKTTTDRLMHEAIALATVRAHDIMEECLKDVMLTEGWDIQTMMPPEFLLTGTVPRKPERSDPVNH